jgi:hypothetical protein
MISARGIIQSRWEEKREEDEPAMEIPRQKHMMDPMNQHQTTEAGPPERRGVFKVVATEDETPMMEEAKARVERLPNSRANSCVHHRGSVRT